MGWNPIPSPLFKILLFLAHLFWKGWTSQSSCCLKVHYWRPIVSFAHVFLECHSVHEPYTCCPRERESIRGSDGSGHIRWIENSWGLWVWIPWLQSALCPRGGARVLSQSCLLVHRSCFRMSLGGLLSRKTYLSLNDCKIPANLPSLALNTNISFSYTGLLLLSSKIGFWSWLVNATLTPTNNKNRMTSSGGAGLAIPQTKLRRRLIRSRSNILGKFNAIFLILLLILCTALPAQWEPKLCFSVIACQI